MPGNALYTFKFAFTVEVSVLEYILHEADGDGKARNYLLSIQRFDFIITLVTIEHVLQSLLPLTHFYKPNNVTSWRHQRKQIVSSPSCNKSGQITRCGIHYRRHCGIGGEIWSSTEQSVLENKYTAKMFPLTHHVSTWRGQFTNQSWTICCRKWTRDCQWLHVTTWLSTSHGNNWCIWPQKEQSSCTKCSKMTCLKISVNYKMKLSLEDMIGIMNVADTLDNMVQDINPDLNPSMYTAVVILMVMSVSTFTTERSFSAMRRLMNYLRSTMTFVSSVIK